MPQPPDEPNGPIPEDNQPGHHPPVEQDKPIDAFVAKARERTRASARQAAKDATVAKPDPPNRSDIGARTGGDPRAQDGGDSGRAAGGRTGSDGASSGYGERQPSGSHAGLSDILSHVPVEAVLPGLALLDATIRPQELWDEIGESRTGWLARIALVPGLGAWRYASSVKPRLAVAARARDLAGG
ncbi:MAG TPA: hypothetical protein VG435_09955 [Acidimicrobiales bacterium]|jgi:hypothetical protein|nr:hypothetical protein [Acidimicrobiales bacterium]